MLEDDTNVRKDNNEGRVSYHSGPNSTVTIREHGTGRIYRGTGFYKLHRSHLKNHHVLIYCLSTEISKNLFEVFSNNQPEDYCCIEITDSEIFFDSCLEILKNIIQDPFAEFQHSVVEYYDPQNEDILNNINPQLKTWYFKPIEYAYQKEYRASVSLKLGHDIEFEARDHHKYKEAVSEISEIKLELFDVINSGLVNIIDYKEI